MDRQFSKIVFIDGPLYLIANALYDGFVDFKQLFLNFVLHEKFISLCSSGIGQDVFRLVPQILGGLEVFIELLEV